MDADAINALFELGGAALLALNIRRLFIDRSVKGVSMWPTLFFSLWGLWNLYFYWAVGTPLSWYAGLLLVSVNATWLIAAWGIKHEEAAKEQQLKDLIATNKALTEAFKPEDVVAKPEFVLSEELVIPSEPPCDGVSCKHDHRSSLDRVDNTVARAKEAKRLQWRLAKRRQRHQAKMKKLKARNIITVKPKGRKS